MPRSCSWRRLLALAFAVAALLAGRLVPEPWASAGVLAIGLSPPALAAATTVAPEPVAGALLAGAAWCALKLRERARLRYAYGAAVMLALLPWLDVPMAAGRRARRRRARPLDAGRAPPAHRADRRGADARLARVLRALERDVLRRAGAGVRASRRRGAGRPRWVAGAGGQPGDALALAVGRAAALGARARAGVLRRLAALALPARARRHRDPRAPRVRASRGAPAGRRRGRLGRRRVRRRRPRRPLVPRPPRRGRCSRSPPRSPPGGSATPA